MANTVSLSSLTTNVTIMGRRRDGSSAMCWKRLSYAMDSAESYVIRINSKHSFDYVVHKIGGILFSFFLMLFINLRFPSSCNFRGQRGIISTVVRRFCLRKAADRLECQQAEFQIVGFSGY